MKDVPEIVLTGGPCAGKTTGLLRLRQWLGDAGIRTFIVPEVATMFIAGGIADIAEIAAEGKRRFIDIQELFLSTQLTFASQFRRASDILGGKAVILYDRGPMDVAAYVPEEFFDTIIKEKNLNLRELRDRFSAVIHLVTAADGAEKYYTLENNIARTETPELARYLDKRTQQAWLGQAHLKVIDNSTDFDGKMLRLTQAVARVLGIPVPIEIERKFLLKNDRVIKPEDWELFLAERTNFRRVEIEQVYLKSGPDEEIRIRKRKAADGSSVCYRTVKKKTTDPAVREEREIEIGAYDYLDLKELRDPGTQIIRKTRFCFLFDRQYFELDAFPGGLALLEVELTEERDEVRLPPFLDVVCEATGQEQYTNYALAHRK